MAPWKMENAAAAARPVDGPTMSSDANDNRSKDAADRAMGDKPMTGAQAARLRKLCEETQRPDMFDDALSEGEASRRIEVLRDSRQGYR